MNGDGATPLIAQNAIQISDGATATITGNFITANLCNAATCGPGVNDYSAIGILLYNLGAGVQISNNTISNNDTGILQDFAPRTNAGALTVISNNQITDNRYYGIFLDEGNATISGNTISGSTDGIAVVAFNQTASASLKKRVVRGRAALEQGKVAVKPDSNVTINSNLITSNTRGIVLIDQNTEDTADLIITTCGNRIVGNTTAGLENTTGRAKTAENNWWGCNAGPNAAGCDKMLNSGSSSVDFNPWLVLTLAGAPNSGHSSACSMTTSSSRSASN